MIPISITASGPSLELGKWSGKDGLYVAATPDDGSKFRLLQLAKRLGADPDPEKLHATVIYSEKVPTDLKAFGRVIDLGRTIKGATINEITHWVGHDKKTYIVAKIISESLVAFNARITTTGAEPSFLPYNPHMTLETLEEGKKIGEKMQSTIDNINKELASTPILISLTVQPPANLKD